MYINFKIFSCLLSIFCAGQISRFQLVRYCFYTLFVITKLLNPTYIKLFHKCLDRNRIAIHLTCSQWSSATILSLIIVASCLQKSSVDLFSFFLQCCTGCCRSSSQTFFFISNRFCFSAIYFVEYIQIPGYDIYLIGLALFKHGPSNLLLLTLIFVYNIFLALS